MGAETIIQRQIKQYLEWQGYWVIRIQCGRVKGGRMHLARTGTSDLITWLLGTGRLFAIETKTPENDLSKEQRDFRDKVIADGGLYVCARCLDDVVRVIKSLKCVR